MPSGNPKEAAPQENARPGAEAMYLGWMVAGLLVPILLFTWLAGTSHAVQAIEGTVLLVGPRPPREDLPVWKHREFCGESIPSERVLVSPQGGLANVVVALHHVRPARPWRPRGIAILDNRDCRFVPRVQVVPLGTTLEVRNSDPMIHTAHAYLGEETLFHIALPAFLRRARASLDRPGLVAFDCDVGHTWMRAYVLVRADPFAAVSAADGRFRIPEVPPGRYRLTAWHEALGTTGQEVMVPARGTARVEVRFRAPTR